MQQLIVEAMLGRMEDLLPESAEIREEALIQAMECTRHLTKVLRALTKSQRQKWVSLLVRALQAQGSFQDRFQEALISDLRILWRADDDPGRNYAESVEQLKTFSKRTSRPLRREICLLRLC